MNIKTFEQFISEKSDNGHWIQDAIKHKGALKKKLGVPEDETITNKEINDELKKIDKKEDKEGKLSKKDAKTKKQLVLAKTLKEINKK